MYKALNTSEFADATKVEETIVLLAIALVAVVEPANVDTPDTLKEPVTTKDPDITELFLAMTPFLATNSFAMF